jgi:hypothetical protein
MREARYDRTSGAARPQETAIKRMTNKMDAQSRTRRILQLAPLALAATLFAACEGENLWTGDASEFEPQLAGISVPPVAFAGENVTVRVDGVAARGVAQVVVSLRGAVVKDTVVVIDPPQTRVSKVVEIAVPAVVADTVLLVQARVVDAGGAASGVGEEIVAIFGPPSVVAINAPSLLRRGELVNVRVTAVGSRKISQIDLVANGALQMDTSISVFPPRSNVTQDIVFLLPHAALDTLLHLAVNARDETGGVGLSKTATLPLVIEAPEVLTIVPPSVSAGAILTVAVQASSARHISELRLEIRGGMVKDTSIRFSPARPSALEFFDVVLPGNLIMPELRVRAYALDRANGVSATDVYTVEAPIGAPSVIVVPWATSIMAGHIADFRVTASSSRPINRVRFRWRGFLKDSINSLAENDRVLLGPETNFVPGVAKQIVTEDIAVETPCTRADAIFMALVTAYDQDGNLSPITTTSILLTGNTECETPVDTTGVDTTSGPRVPSRLPKGISKVGGLSFNSVSPVVGAPGVALPAGRTYALVTKRRSALRGRVKRARLD